MSLTLFGVLDVVNSHICVGKLGVCCECEFDEPVWKIGIKADEPFDGVSDIFIC